MRNSVNHLKVFSTSAWSCSILLSTLLAFGVQPVLGSASVSDVKKAIVDQKLEEAVKLSFELSRELGTKITENEKQAASLQATERMRTTPQTGDLLQLVNGLEMSLRAGEKREAFIRSMILHFAIGKQWYGTDPGPRFQQSLQTANSRGDFNSLYDVAVQGIRAKRYQDVLGAAEAAWKLKDTEQTLKIAADGMHNVQQIGAMAAIELNQYDRASQLILRSVDLPGRLWARSEPDLRPAKMLLAAQQRTAVLAYLEACDKVNWKNGNQAIRKWIEDLKQGRTPALP